MGVSRRAFLRCAACAPFAVAGSMASGSQCATGRDEAAIVLVDSSCALRESFEGYKAGAAAAGVNCTLRSPGCGVNTSLVVLPAASLTSSNEARWLRGCAKGGATVLVESGGMFLSPAEFWRHQSIVRSVFGLAALPPVDLWQQRDRGIPYVDFTWPVPARVRDFSRLIPLVAFAAGRHVGNEVREIARVGSAAAGVKVRITEGTLIFLGSPLGPHLLSGDREARSWFRALVAIARAPSRRGGVAPKVVFDVPRERTLTDDSV